MRSLRMTRNARVFRFARSSLRASSLSRERPWLSGVAVVQDSPVAPYLTKFAVERQAQGEGIGGELWSMLIRDFPRFFWRSRAVASR